MTTEAASEDASAGAPEKHLPPAFFGLLIIPFGMVTGYCGVTLPFLLAEQMRSDPDATTKIAAFTSLVNLPHAWKFVIEPALDARWRKKSWYVGAIAVTTTFLFASILLQRMRSGLHVGGAFVGQLAAMGVLLFVANASVATASGAMHALMASTLPPEARGKAGGFAMAGNLGGYGVGGAIGLFLAQRLSSFTTSVCVAGIVVATALPALWIREKAHPPHPIFQAVKLLLRDAWRTLKSRDGWTGLVICLTPVGCGGLSNLFSTIAPQYHASGDQVALVNGLFGGLVSAVGSVVGGYLADRMHRRVAYGLAGFASAAVAMGLAIAPMTPTVYTVGCLTYQFAIGVAFATWIAFVLDLMGDDAGVATKHAIFAAAGNLASSYMNFVDGAAVDGHFLPKLLGSGPKAAMKADALGTIAGLVVLVWMLYLARNRPPAEPNEVRVY